MGPSDLKEILSGLAGRTRPDILMGMEAADDAGVVRINDDMALVMTVDYFAPVLDDPYQFGRVAAANALSDVYACGGKPMWALSIAAFPSGDFPPDVFRDILRGGMDLAWEEGCAVIGGHTIEDSEIKFGLAVVGTANPNCILSKAGAKPGDRIYLTKPLGSGILSTTLKAGYLSTGEIAMLTRFLTTTNRLTSEAMQVAKAHAATDVTGFGLLGHASEVARASAVCLELSAARLPMMPGAVIYYNRGLCPGGLYRNREFVREFINDSAGWQEQDLDIACDPQTNGGILTFIPEAGALVFEAEINRTGGLAAHIGQVTAGKAGTIELVS